MKQVILRIALCLIVLGCTVESGPLNLQSDQYITQATIYAYLKGQSKATVILTDVTDLKFLEDHLVKLKSQMYDHSMPEIDLTLKVSNGQIIELRISNLEIGLGAPASDYNRHWFPADASLYNFLVMKAYGNSSL